MSREMPLYKKYAETKTVGYYCMSNWGGLEILDYEYCGEYAVACFNFGGVRQQIRRHKVQVSDSGRLYIRKQGRRYYFDQILRA